MCSAHNLAHTSKPARWLKLACLLACSVLFAFSAYADLNVNIYAGVGSGTIKNGTTYVEFDLVGFTGTIGNATFSNVTLDLAIPSGYQGGTGQRLAAIPYTVTSGSLFITEVR